MKINSIRAALGFIRSIDPEFPVYYLTLQLFTGDTNYEYNVRFSGKDGYFESKQIGQPNVDLELFFHSPAGHGFLYGLYCDMSSLAKSYAARCKERCVEPAGIAIRIRGRNLDVINDALASVKEEAQ